MACKCTCRCLVTMSSVNTRNETRHLRTNLWPAYYKCDVRRSLIIQGNDHVTQPKLHCTAREEVKFVVQWKKEMYMSQREEGYRKIKLYQLHCHSELLLQETVYPYKFHTS